MIKSFVKIISVFLLLAISTISFAQAQNFVEQDYGYGNEDLDYGYGNTQGLAYINIKAKQFISEYNQQNHTNWQSHKVNAKTLVPKCAVELKAKWEKVILDASGNIPDKYVIAVYCEKPLDPNRDKWRVWAPVYNEQGKMITSIK